MPTFAATGAKMGTSTITPGKGSMKMPKSNKKMLMTIKKVHGLSCISTIQLATVCGTPSMVKIQANDADMPMMRNTEAVNKAERDKMSGTAYHSRVRYTYLPQISA